MKEIIKFFCKLCIFCLFVPFLVSIGMKLVEFPDCSKKTMSCNFSASKDANQIKNDLEENCNEQSDCKQEE